MRINERRIIMERGITLEEMSREFETFDWCECKDTDLAYELSLNLTSRKLGYTMKHIVTYVKCQKCKGMITIESS